MFILDQLSRLHMILKPFMLRRIKRDVENELSEKVPYLYAFYNLRSRRLEVVGARKKRAREKESRVSPSRAPVLFCAHYFQAPATQTMLFSKHMYAFLSAGVFALMLLLCCMQSVDKKRFHVLTRNFWGHFVYFLYHFRLKSSLCVISQQDSAGFIKLWEIKSPLMILFTRQRLLRQLMQQRAAWWI